MSRFLIIFTSLAPFCCFAWDYPAVNPSLVTKKAELNIWFAADYVRQPAFLDLKQAFEKAYPHVKLKYTGYEWEAILTKLKMAISMGMAPDIAHQHAFAFGANGMAEDLTDNLRKTGEESAFIKSAMMDVTWNGRIYGVPLDINCLLLFYNTEMFDRAKLKYPDERWTFEKLREAARKLTVDSDGDGKADIYGIYPPAHGWAMFGLIAAAGGTLLTQKNGEIFFSLDAPEVISTVSFFADMVRKEKIAPMPPTQKRQVDNPVWMFASGKVAMFFSGPWDVGRLDSEFKTKIRYGIAQLPGKVGLTRPGSVLGGGALMIPKGGKNKDMAFEYIRWATSSRHQMAMAATMARFPTRKVLYQDPLLAGNKLLAPFYVQLETARPYLLEAFPRVADAFDRAVKSAFFGEKPDQVLNDAQKGANRIRSH